MRMSVGGSLPGRVDVERATFVQSDYGRGNVGIELRAGSTRDHLDAVSRFGYSQVHRRSFRPPSLFDTIDASEAREC